MSKDLKEILQVGSKIRIGREYAKDHGLLVEGQVIVLVDGSFDCENGLYCYTENCPAIWNEQAKEFDSIYHLFGNDLENFMDCKVIE